MTETIKKGTSSWTQRMTLLLLLTQLSQRSSSFWKRTARHRHRLNRGEAYLFNSWSLLSAVPSRSSGICRDGSSCLMSMNSTTPAPGESGNTTQQLPSLNGMPPLPLVTRSRSVSAGGMQRDMLGCRE